MRLLKIVACVCVLVVLWYIALFAIPLTRNLTEAIGLIGFLGVLSLPYLVMPFDILRQVMQRHFRVAALIDNEEQAEAHLSAGNKLSSVASAYFTAFVILSVISLILLLVFLTCR